MVWYSSIIWFWGGVDNDSEKYSQPFLLLSFLVYGMVGVLVQIRRFLMSLDDQTVAAAEHGGLRGED